MGVGSVVVDLARPDFQFRDPKILILKGSGTSALKIGRPKNAKFHHDGSNPPSSAL